LKVQVPFTRAGVAHHVWIESEQGAVLFDVGDGALRDILSQELALDKLKGIFFTHGHFDHMGGLHSLLGYLRMVGREAELPIWSPQGCAEVNAAIIGFISCYPDTIPFQIHARECLPRKEIDFIGMAVEAYPVVHSGDIARAGKLSRVPAMGYRISCQGETVAISGDSADCPALRELAKDADIALIEATFPTNTNVSRDVLSATHLTEGQAIEIGRTAKDYLLVHIGTR
jgi:ribonuclease Z